MINLNDGQWVKGETAMSRMDIKLLESQNGQGGRENQRSSRKMVRGQFCFEVKEHYQPSRKSMHKRGRILLPETSSSLEYSTKHSESFHRISLD